MNLAKTSLLSFISTTVKLLAGLIINKALALYGGPAGLALIGQFQNVSQLAMMASQGAINQGVTKYTAELGREHKGLPELFSTAIKINFCCSLIVGLILITFSTFLSEFFLNDVEFRSIFVIFGITILFYSLNTLLLAILNGLKEVKTFINVNIVQSLCGLIFTTILIIFLGVEGALIALVTNQSVIFLYILWKLKEHSVIKFEVLRVKFSSRRAKQLLNFAFMAATPAIAVPLSHIFIRSFLTDELGVDSAGYWQAIWYISTMYLMVITTALSIYYLPRLSEIRDKTELKFEILSGYRLIIPVVTLLSFIMFFLKDMVIFLLFTNEFLPVRELFLWQLIGGVIKIGAWLLSFLMIAKAMTKRYIASELISSISFVFLSVLFVKHFGLIGITYAYTLNYTIYFLMVCFFVKEEFK